MYIWKGQKPVFQTKLDIRNVYSVDFPGPVVKTSPSSSGVWVWSLVGKLKSKKIQNIKQNHCCNKFNQDMVHI